MSGHDEINAILDLITTNAATTLRIQDRYGVEEGKPASFLILDAPTAFEACASSLPASTSSKMAAKSLTLPRP